MPLNDEHVAAWLDDLRTTTAPQATEALTSIVDDRVGYCCLGRGEVVRGAEAEGEAFRGALATREFIDWLGLDLTDHDDSLHRHSECDCEFDLYLDWPTGLHVGQGLEEMGVEVTAAYLNDSGFTFSQIADLFSYFGIKGVGNG